MRRTILLLATMTLTLLMAIGVALAVNKIGTQGRDFLQGTDAADHLVGKGENDRIFSLAGKDNLIGGPGKDWVWGGRRRSLHGDLPVHYTSSGGEKHLVGASGNDVLWGGKGSDNAVGNSGNDLLIGGEYHHPVKDALSGGGGNDVFSVDNDPAGKDIVRCGGGYDWVFADRKDVVASNCEKVGDRVSEYDEVGNSIPQSFWKSLPYPIGPQYPSRPGDYAKAQGLAKAFEKANINPLVGDWRRKRTCDELVSRLKQAGLADQIGSHQDLLAEFGAGDGDQGSQDPDDPCRGVNGRLAHDHIFYRDGRFTSVDQNGNFVDDGHYILPNDHTIVFPGSGSKTFPPVKAHFRFSDHLNTVKFDLVLPKNLDECSKHCQGTYAWAISVFFSGLPWHRVCQADDRDNNVNGRTDELGEPCWIEPVKGFTYD
jgi:hypothetical protein